MSALRPVEGHHELSVFGGRFLNLLIGCVFVWVRDTSSFAESRHALAKPATDKKGRECGENNVASSCEMRYEDL